jgi:Na+/H+ antiporter NhaC
MISDTTIAATQSLGTDLKDKIIYRFPAAIITILFFYQGLNSIYRYLLQKTDFNW